MEAACSSEALPPVGRRQYVPKTSHRLMVSLVTALSRILLEKLTVTQQINSNTALALCSPVVTVGTHRSNIQNCYVPPIQCIFVFYVDLREGQDMVATGYGLGGPGIESLCRRYFPHPSRPALGPTQPSLQ